VESDIKTENHKNRKRVFYNNSDQDVNYNTSIS